MILPWPENEPRALVRRLGVQAHFLASRAAGTAMVVSRFRGDLVRGWDCIDVDQCQRCRGAFLCAYWSTSMGSSPVEYVGCAGSAVEVARDAAAGMAVSGTTPGRIDIDVDQC